MEADIKLSCHHQKRSTHSKFYSKTSDKQYELVFLLNIIPGNYSFRNKKRILFSLTNGVTYITQKVKIKLKKIEQKFSLSTITLHLDTKLFQN